ncbi:MAG: glycosyltransferase family 4 protein, partial [Planctomycetales bacterium]|nr:glycosyltransferase family 4 protein [Planctomycetales bacterium]
MKVFINALPIRHGGVLTVLLGLVKGLREASDDLDLTVLTSAERTYNAVVGLRCADRVDRRLVGSNAPITYAWENMFLGRHVQAAGADVVLTFNHYLHNVSCPQVVYFNNLRRFSKQYRSTNPFNMLAEAVRDRAAAAALKRADANVFESTFLLDAAAASHLRPIRNPHVIYVGLPDRLLDAPSETTSSGAESRRLVAITSPQPHKDNETMIRTLAELVRREPETDWRLDVAGGVTAHAFDPLRRLAAELGVGVRITWHGYCDHHQLASLLRNGLCLLAASRLESFAMVPLEAMAYDCPPVVANYASMPESIGQAGLLAEPGSASSF